MKPAYFYLILLFVVISCKEKPKETIKEVGKEQISFNETYRPQFHFSPPKNWHNDPNGLIYYDGEYHMFYQYNPKGNEWGYMHWGHAISRDLLHWDILPIAIYPDSSSTDIRKCTAWSGSGIVDWQNILGKQQGDVHTLVVFYTSHQCGQRMAYSTDKGRSWQKYEGNPIIPFLDDDARDPFVRWHEPTGKYIMAVFRKPENNRAKQGNSIYTSENLIDWELSNHHEGFFEVPGLFELEIENLSTNKWVMSGGNGDYKIGDFDGAVFTPQTEMITGDFGKNYWAPQTYFGIPEKDGRVIQIAWMRDGIYPDMPFNQQMTFPVELNLVESDNGILLSKKPIREISNLYTSTHRWEQKILAENAALLDELDGQLFHIKIKFKNMNADKLILNVRKGADGGNRIVFDFDQLKVKFNNQIGPLVAHEGMYSVEILVDRASVEIFANRGTMVMTNNFLPQPGYEGLHIRSGEGKVELVELVIHELKSIYK